MKSRRLPQARHRAAACANGLTATSGDPGVISLSWNAVAGADSYTIKRGATPGGPYAIVDNVTTARVTPTSAWRWHLLLCGHALKNAGESAASEWPPPARWSISPIAQRPRPNPRCNPARTRPRLSTARTRSGLREVGTPRPGSRPTSALATKSRWSATTSRAPTMRRRAIRRIGAASFQRWHAMDHAGQTQWRSLWRALPGESISRQQPRAYRYYRLNLLSNSNGDSSSGFQLAELALLAEKEPANAGKR